MARSAKDATSTGHLFVGVDVGTTSTKAAVVDKHGHILGSGYESYPIGYDGQGRYLQDAEDWKRATIKAVDAAIADVNRDRIRALSISAQGGTLVPVDHDSRPLLPARSWLDRRGAAQADRLRRVFGERDFFERTGWPIAPNNTCTQMLALRDEEPNVYDRAAYFLDTASYMNFWLAGSPVMDTNIAGITQLMNVNSEAWDPDVLDLLQVEERRLPLLARPGSLLGVISPVAFTDLGLSPSTLVIAGGHDQYCAALGVNVVNDGDLLLSTGTAWVALGIGTTVLRDYACGFALGRHFVPSLFGHFGEVPSGGISLDWLQRLVQEGGTLEDFEQLVSATEPGAGGVLFFPNFDGTSPYDLNGSSRGSFLGLELGHEKRHLARAVMEGVVFQTAQLLDTYRATTGRDFTPTVVGGATKSSTWTALIADILGSDLKVSTTADAACVGAAILAATGSGAYAEVPEAASMMSAPTVHVSPDGERSAYYAARRKSYDLAALRLAQLYGELAPLNSAGSRTENE